MKKYDINKRDNLTKKIDLLVRFKQIFKNENLLRLNISRFLNNISFVSFSSCISIIISNMVSGNLVKFSEKFGIAQTAVSLGFIASSFLGVSGIIKNSNLFSIVILTSAMSFSRLALAILSTSIYLKYIACFSTGFGTFFFRISGITIGQFYTPKEHLSTVIIAGDGMVRLYSAIISAIAIFLFSQGFIELLIRMFSPY